MSRRLPADHAGEGREVGGKGPRRGRGRRDAGAHHREADQEGEEVQPERLVGGERGAGGLGYLVTSSR